MMKVIEQTDEEKLAMYMKLSKVELAKMLIEANRRYAGPIPIYIPIETKLPEIAPYSPQIWCKAQC